MSRKYDVSDPRDRNTLNHVLNRYGVHFETDLFGETYILLDHLIYFPDKYWAEKYKKTKRNTRKSSK